MPYNLISLIVEFRVKKNLDKAAAKAKKIPSHPRVEEKGLVVLKNTG